MRIADPLPSQNRDHADPDKLARHGPFDPQLYRPITVEEHAGRLRIMDGMTRVENARRAGLARLAAYVFPRG
ncbi:MAG: hypothetical protein ACRCT8_14815 [Lacipirellulaceae bacterium]